MTMVRERSMPGKPIAVSVTRRIKPGCENAFQALLAGIHETAQHFEGYLGREVIRAGSDERPEYTVIFRFDRESNLRAWEISPERREWLSRMQGIIVSATPHRILTGLETWFTIPSAGPIIPPPRYKMVIVTWLAVFPLVSLISYGASPILDNLPTLARALLMTTVLVPLMTYVVMPRMTRLFQRWLYSSIPRVPPGSSLDD